MRLRGNVEDLSPNFGDKELVVASPQRIISHFLFHQITFDQNQNDCRPHPTLLFSVSLIEDNNEGRHFYTTEVIDTESQEVLNTLREHDFQDAFKTWQKRWEMCKRAEGTTSRVMVASRPKLSF
jgi:hypothetical protein